MLNSQACSCCGLVHRLAELAAAVSGATDLRVARRTLLEHVAGLLDTPWVALSRPFDGDELGFVAVSDSTVRRVTRIEQRLHSGPAWTVHATRRAVVVDDVAAAHQWPRYGAEVSSNSSIRAAVGLPLLSGGELLVGLHAYADRPGHFAGARTDRALLIAQHAGPALAGVAARVKAANLELALRSNREIGIAVGIVMDRLRLPDDLSFGYLRRVSQRQHVKLSELAARIVVSGELPTDTVTVVRGAGGPADSITVGRALGRAAAAPARRSGPAARR
jgi:GAF domain-containing protein